MSDGKTEFKPIIRMRALNTFVLEPNEEGLLEYKTAGHKFEVLREGSEEWESIEIESQIIEINNNVDEDQENEELEDAS